MHKAVLFSFVVWFPQSDFSSTHFVRAKGYVFPLLVRVSYFFIFVDAELPRVLLPAERLWLGENPITLVDYVHTLVRYCVSKSTESC